jgi:hypothetical protein
MTALAYMIGRTSAYDQCLIENNLEEKKKLGKRVPSEGFPEGYEGGCVWRTPSEANNFRLNHLHIMDPSWKPDSFSVYELELPNGWNLDTSYNSKNQYSNLLVDSLILRKVVID